MDADFKGDSEHPYNCTGDVCSGDEVRFQRALFTGGYRNAKFVGFELVTAKVVSESYGDIKGQHTFTLECPAASPTKFQIKGRNLYRNGVWRKPWADEALRRSVLEEKHSRGDRVRARKVKFQELYGLHC